MARASVARVRPTADGAVVCERCEVPESAFGRMRGLLGRDGLEPGSGMLIDRAPSVHMFFMRFAIDVVFVDRDWRVVGVRHGVRPWRVAAARRAVAALELPDGAAAAAGIEEGDVLALESLPSDVHRSGPSACVQFLNGTCMGELWIRRVTLCSARSMCLGSKRIGVASQPASGFVKRWEKAALCCKTLATTRGSALPVAFRRMIDGWV